MRCDRDETQSVGLAWHPRTSPGSGHRADIGQSQVIAPFRASPDSLHWVLEETAITDWYVVLKRSFGIPDIVSGANAEAVIEGWIREHLESSNMIQADRDDAAKKFMPAIKELAVDGALDSYVLGALSRYFRPLGDRSAAELVVREAFPEVTVLTTETAEALLAVAGEITDRMFDYVETHKFPPD